ncbi:hypothetical protein Tco_1535476 [Tanacetum coccineum]
MLVTPVTPDSEGTSQPLRGEVMETFASVSKDTQNWIIGEPEAVQIILTGIDNDIYSTVDACPNAMEMWKAIKRLKHGESINVQDLETNLYWEFRKFTSHEGESLKSFVTIVKQNQDLKNVSYHKLYDILKQHQNEVNEIRDERLARTANPLALVAQQQPVYHPQSNPIDYTQNSSTRSQAAPRNRGKATTHPPPYDPEPEVDTDDDSSSKDKEIDKLMALITTTFKKIYKPTNHNLRIILLDPTEAHGMTDRVDIMRIRGQSSTLHVHGKDSKVSLDAVDNYGPIFDSKPLQKVQDCDDNYNVFTNDVFDNDSEHPGQPNSKNDTYPVEQGDNHITLDSSNMSNNG